jgi:hypothetical protein
LGPRPPVMRRPGPDRTATYSSAPQRPARATARVPVRAPAPDATRVAGTAPVSPPPQRSVEATPESSALAAALTGARPEPQPGKGRTLLTILVVVAVASFVGAGIAWFFGEQILDLIGNFTG